MFASGVSVGATIVGWAEAQAVAATSITSSTADFVVLDITCLVFTVFPFELMLFPGNGNIARKCMALYPGHHDLALGFCPLSKRGLSISRADFQRFPSSRQEDHCPGHRQRGSQPTFLETTA